MLDIAHLIFSAFAGLTLLSAIMVVTQNNPVRSVLFLVLTFFGAAVLWLMLQAEFLSLILVLVYVGAVMTLFLFVVMMLNVDVEALRSHLLRLLPLGLIIVAGLSALFLMTLKQSPLPSFEGVKNALGTATPHTFPAFDSIDNTKAVSNTEQIGLVLYTQYVYPFELAAVILLVAMIAAITLTHRTIARSKRQDIRHQIMTQSKDRIVLVSLDESGGGPPVADETDTKHSGGKSCC